MKGVFPVKVSAENVIKWMSADEEIPVNNFVSLLEYTVKYREA